MNCDYIIVQAGGKGTRLEHLTINKPKCLVPINNLPMLFHLFRKFPDKKYIIIGDYKYDVLREYLKVFADIQYILINSQGRHGTLSGISDSLKLIPNNKPFMLIWSDLVLSEEFILPESGDYIGISKDFRCRWKYENHQFQEEPSEEHGVAGLFVFSNKQMLGDVPEEGEFVRWLGGKSIIFKELPLYKSKEYGLLSEYKKLEVPKCRPFNQLIIAGDRVTKIGIDQQGQHLARKEKAWYQLIEQVGYTSVPKIYSYEPFTMEKIKGQNIYEYKELPFEQKKSILENIIMEIKKLHSLGKQETDYFSMKEAYITKTFDRLSQVRDLIPFANQDYIVINGRKCKNVYFYQNKLEERLSQLEATEFRLLHGDCTFSNLMLDEHHRPILLDPRGYFGFTKYYGDAAYDWAKLYYSLVGNYDQFNIKNFNLSFVEGEVELRIASNGWEALEAQFFKLLGNEVTERQIKLIHAVIWLSLTTYAWEDYDSICGAFYNGLYYLEEVL
ncbi:nucleoside-diphosphate-sugar pyrophosphorylase [Paenibacillus oralis]|uniref:Nucleoside-diphosphate-sugar pyrophosphorylase n=1 Tax=Paenibacillus oralis TaxID=2490856 RepID=A0A3P3TX57_9BACL|nr:phosphotransferase [Paenibacillus oralis]RRJ62286.1 nucleoside-diphosphate-sugar pyrophosphorylase [Paenibacillus oralis]